MNTITEEMLNNNNYELSINNNLVYEELENGYTIILNKTNGTIIKLKRMGFLILKLCNSSFYSEVKEAFLKEYKIDEDNSFFDEFKKTLVHLIKNQFIIVKIIEVNKSNIMSNIVLQNVYIEITSMCNCICNYCYNNSGFLGKHMNSILLKKIINELITLNVKNITFSGGEPTLNPILKESIDKCISAGVEVNIITNAWFGDDDYFINMIKDCNIQFTLDNYIEEKHDIIKGKGNYDAVLKANLKLLEKKHSGKRKIRININNENMRYVDDFIRMANDLIVDEIDFRLLQNLGRNKDNINQLSFIKSSNEIENLMRKLENLQCSNTSRTKINYSGCLPEFKCNYLIKSDNIINCILRINLVGEIFPCQYFTDDYFRVGNLNHQSILEIINGKVLNQLIGYLNKRTNNNLVCSNCVWQYLCKRGCPATTFNRYNTIWDKSSECKELKKIFEYKSNIR